MSAGYSAYAVRIYNIGTIHLHGYIPIKAGVKYLLGPFYAEAQFGASFMIKYNENVSFIYSPGMGCNIGDHVDIGVRYEAWSHNGTVSQLAARLGFGF